MATCTAGIGFLDIMSSANQELPTTADAMIAFVANEKLALFEIKLFSELTISISAALAGIKDCSKYP